MLAIVAVTGAVIAGVSSNFGSGPTEDFADYPINLPRTIEAAETISEECNEAAEIAVTANQAIYDKERALFDQVDADGTRTDEEDSLVMQLLDSTDEEYVRVLAPTFASCVTASEWIGVAQRYPAFVGYTDPAGIADDTLQNYCREFLTSRVCIDAVAQGIEMLPAPSP